MRLGGGSSYARTVALDVALRYGGRMGFTLTKTRNNGVEKWVSIYTYYDDAVVRPDGKRQRLYIRGYGDTEALARKRMDENIAKRFSGGYKGRAGGPLFREHFEQWIAWKIEEGVGPESIRKYRNEGKQHLVAFIGELRVSALTDERLKKLFYTELKDIGTSARFHAYTNLNNCLNYAVRLGHIDTNPLVRVKKPVHKSTVAEDDEKFIDKRSDIFVRLLNELEKPEHPYHDYYALFLLSLLGLRRAEVLGLEWSCFTSLEKKGHARIHVQQQLSKYEKDVEGRTGDYIKRRTKSGKVRSFYLPEKVRRELVRLKRENRGEKAKKPEFSNLVSLKPNGQHITYNYFHKVWRDSLTSYMTKNGRTMTSSDYWRPHANRHIAASILYDHGIDIETVKDILGHSDTAMSLHYTHLTKGKKLGASETLDGVLTGETTPKGRTTSRKS